MKKREFLVIVIAVLIFTWIFKLATAEDYIQGKFDVRVNGVQVDQEKILVGSVGTEKGVTVSWCVENGKTKLEYRIGQDDKEEINMFVKIPKEVIGNDVKEDFQYTFSIVTKPNSDQNIDLEINIQKKNNQYASTVYLKNVENENDNRVFEEEIISNGKYETEIYYF